MRVALFIVAVGSFLGVGHAQVFRTESISPSRLSQSETRAYESIRANKGTLRVKLVSIQSGALSGGNVELELFDGMRGHYAGTWDSRESRWKGGDGNGGRFSIRMVNGRYVGYAIHKGKRYVLSPLGNGASALYEQEPNLQCATDVARRP
jgi:hypothetical protein